MIKPAISALLARKNSILEMIRREMLPVMANITQMMQLSKMNLVINLTGIRESVYNILGHEFDGEEIIQRYCIQLLKFSIKANQLRRLYTNCHDYR